MVYHRRRKDFLQEKVKQNVSVGDFVNSGWDKRIQWMKVLDVDSLDSGQKLLTSSAAQQIQQALRRICICHHSGGVAAHLLLALLQVGKQHGTSKGQILGLLNDLLVDAGWCF